MDGTTRILVAGHAHANGTRQHASDRDDQRKHANNPRCDRNQRKRRFASSTHQYWRLFPKSIGRCARIGCHAWLPSIATLTLHGRLFVHLLEQRRPSRGPNRYNRQPKPTSARESYTNCVLEPQLCLPRNRLLDSRGELW